MKGAPEKVSRGSKAGERNASSDPPLNKDRRIEVIGPLEENPKLALTIRRAILRLAAGRIRDLKVEVRRGTIVIEGRSASFYSKQLAQHAAMELAPGQPVVNRLEVPEMPRVE